MGYMYKGMKMGFIQGHAFMLLKWTEGKMQMFKGLCSRALNVLRSFPALQICLISV